MSSEWAAGSSCGNTKSSNNPGDDGWKRSIFWANPSLNLQVEHLGAGTHNDGGLLALRFQKGEPGARIMKQKTVSGMGTG